MAEDKKDVSYSAGWTENLRHRPDPNRVSSLQTPAPGQFYRVPAQVGAPLQTTTRSLGRAAFNELPQRPRHDPQSRLAEPSYYDVPMLKQPVWKWQIASYFFFGGLSAGAYVLSRVADRFGGEKFRDVAKIGAYVAMATILPCPPLLIADLGDPKRFHHMLRVWKPSTPMNLGTWSIVAYSGMATFEVVRQYLTSRQRKIPRAQRATLLKLMNNGTLLLVHDATGVPFALMVAGYTGVLLSCTSNPLWCKNPWLGPLFSASALSTGAEAVSLALDLTTDREDDSAQRILSNVDSVSHAAELGCMQGFMRYAGEKAKVLREGKMAGHHAFSTVSILIAEGLKRIPGGPMSRRIFRMVSSILGLLAGFSLRWSMVFGGHDAAADPHTSRLVSKP